MDAQLSPRRPTGQPGRGWNDGRVDEQRRAALFALPGVAYAAAFVVMPLMWVLFRSVSDPSVATYAQVARTPEHVRELGTTIRLALLTTTVSLVLGYPYAYAMARVGWAMRRVLAALITLPFWTSVLVRTYAWTILLQDSGLVNSVLRQTTMVDDPVPLMRNTFGVVVGLTHIVLPFVVLPVYATLRQIDPDLVDAAHGLGATDMSTFRRVVLPLSMPGVAAGGALAFLLAQGFYLTPALLGHPREETLAEAVVDLVTQRLAFGEGAALATVLLVLAVTVCWLAMLTVRLLLRRVGGR